MNPESVCLIELVNPIPVLKRWLRDNCPFQFTSLSCMEQFEETPFNQQVESLH